MFRLSVTLTVLLLLETLPSAHKGIPAVCGPLDHGP